MFNKALVAAAALTLSGVASANFGNMAIVSGTLTADNHYGVYLGDADGSNLSFIGRNEYGDAGSPGQYNWSLAETWEFLAAPGQYLYVMAWDDGGPQGWIGSFSWHSGELDSNTSDWVSAVAPAGNPGKSGDLPSSGVLSGYIAGATWTAPAASAANGSSPWGSIAGVGDAQWIWHDTLADNSLSNANFAMFRSANPLVAAVPEPSTYAMMGLGLGMVLLVVRRKRQTGNDRVFA
ncbi:MAG: PEP-CTERM sorting domain-containing protein [Pseudomonadota bacterium]